MDKYVYTYKEFDCTQEPHGKIHQGKHKLLYFQKDAHIHFFSFIYKYYLSVTSYYMLKYYLQLMRGTVFYKYKAAF